MPDPKDDNAGADGVIRSAPTPPAEARPWTSDEMRDARPTPRASIAANPLAGKCRMMTRAANAATDRCR